MPARTYEPRDWEVVSRSGTQLCRNVTESQALGKVWNDNRIGYGGEIARQMEHGPTLRWIEEECED